jgi:hypothetical protein
MIVATTERQMGDVHRLQYQNWAAATNDIGIITLPDGRHLAVAVFLTDSRSDDAARDKTIARVARAAWETWVATSVRPLTSRPR